MKKYRYTEGSNVLLDKISYTDNNELKILIKYFLTHDCETDSTEVCILADLKTILGLYKNSKEVNILTPKQRKVITEHLINDKIQSDLANELGITQQGVSILLASGLQRIKTYILTGELKWMPWSSTEKEYLLNNYPKMDIYDLSKELNRPHNKVVSMYHYLKNKE